ncbi:serine/threonine-protein phosphatase 7 [Hordeum vulgare]|nr:serine/threonine-protein phosphatase 7 [Hordeum vulgare]
MSEKAMKLMPLKIRSHGASTVMSYDERYIPYIEMTGLLPFIQLVSRSTPNLNIVAISALTDRRRPETHSLNLRTGEMTVTLEDVMMITALSVEGKPLCMSTDSEGWRHQMEALIELEVEDGRKKDRVPTGASFTWIAANFAHCPEDANDEVIQTYARVYMWYVIFRTIFADGTDKNAPWMWLKALTVFDNKFSWGSAALAYLYWQLDEACRRSTKDVGIGGCSSPVVPFGSWEESNITPAHIDYLRRTRRLPPADLVEACVPGDELSSHPRNGECVLFGAHFLVGFALSVSGFFRRFLASYGLHMHHLGVNAILYIAYFITLCEDYLGLRPFSSFFRYFFYFRAQKHKKNGRPYSYGGVVVYRWRRPPFPGIIFKDSCKKWQRTFFYVCNLDEDRDWVGLEPFTDQPTNEQN